tara:strand:+ start:1535 stop:1714 length:180 start_codon:yes stop_codon:yes gene_type:complete
MKLNNHGLTVGELTIAVGVLIIIGLIWTTVNKKQGVKETSFLNSNPLELTINQSKTNFM